jgi:serine/threonine protein kinase
MSFRERHWFLHGVYNSILDPCAISARELDNVSKRAGLTMEEILSWFEDEKSRRMELLLACQNIQPQQSDHQYPMSPATTTSGLNTTAPLNLAGWPSTLPSTTTQQDENWPFVPPFTTPADGVSVPVRAKRGRPSKNQSLMPSVSPSPEAKRQKCSEYPCPDCSKLFAAERWSEHVKRVHFPDHIWECQITNGRRGKPCTSKPFFRPDNFATHLRGEHCCLNEEIAQLKIACKLPLIDFFHQNCGFIGCQDTFKTRDESIEHIKDHFKELAQSANPPKDLGISQWKENCSSGHTLKRGVHYHVSQMDITHPDDGDEDENDDNSGSGDGNSSNQPDNHHGSSLDDSSSPDGQDHSPGLADYNFGQGSNDMNYGQYSAMSPSPQACTEGAVEDENTKLNLGSEEFLLHFTIRRRLGFGGHGLVDEVSSVSSAETFARKSVLRNDGVSAASTQISHLMHELLILKELDHPHLVKLIGAYADAKYWHIVMSPVAEQNLAQYMLSCQSDQQPHWFQWMGCLASAMDYLHSQGIQHLDVKPSNILLKNDVVLLTDFGTAKSLNLWPSAPETLKATPMYCAPETMLHGHQEYSSDIFSLGCVFSEMITRLSGRTIGEFQEFRSNRGQRSFYLTVPEVITWITLLSWVESSNPSYSAERHRQFRDVIIRMLAEKSLDRPSAGELCSCLEDPDCSRYKSRIPGPTASSRLKPSDHKTSSTPKTIFRRPFDSTSTINIAALARTATATCRPVETALQAEPLQQNPTSPTSQLSQPLVAATLLVDIADGLSQLPEQDSGRPEPLTIENIVPHVRKGVARSHRHPMFSAIAKQGNLWGES